MSKELRQAHTLNIFIMTKFFLLITLFLVIVSCNKDANAQQAQIIERINHLSLSNNADSLLLIFLQHFVSKKYSLFPSF